ncbi:hypothetical protein [Azorhizobium doebereinerae]|uniref:hypothetical protein n=1 Tax=Azorhizobium doebereinerae TaxID=281091 RepID=UPI000414D499|nr:hypothetical protein [Azorhizobium doebereinerae]
MTLSPRSGRPLSLAKLEHALALHGPDLADWPADLRASAELTLARDTAARALLADAERTEALLRRHLTGALTREDEAFGRRVAARLATLPLPAQDRSWAQRIESWLAAAELRPAWPGVAAFAAMALLGFIMGSHVVDAGFSYRPTVPAVAVADVSAIMFEPDPIAENGL